ncbi:MAG: alkene reductase, partial [Rhodocyclaceae bacterium]
MNSPLFQPFSLGALTLPNRVVMPPLTRARAGQPGNVPTTMNAEYYAQRASAGL